MEMEELRKAMDEAFFARCVWQEGDLDGLNKIGLLPEDKREEFMEYAARAVHDAMCSAGWEALEFCLDDILDENSNDVDDNDEDGLKETHIVFGSN